MLRNIVLLLNLFILLIYQALVSNTVSINQKSPETVNAGDEFTVEITINKGTIAGFAKFQQDLPAGFTASNGDAKGGSFSFSEQKVKFIWMSLPADAEFKISYKVKVADNVSGDFTFNGIFSYLENNDKKNAEMPAKKIKVTPTASAPIASNTPAASSNNNDNDDEDEEDDDTPVATTSTNTNTSSSTTTTTAPIAQNNNNATSEDEDEDEDDETPAKPAMNTDNTSQTNTFASGSIKCNRTINTANLASNREIIVTITVEKGVTSGFAKLQETLPLGFTASNIDASQGVFSFVDQKAKFLWMSLPVESTIKVSYKITVAPGITGVYYLNGEFSYVENDETKKSIIERQEINLDGVSAPIAQNNNQADMNSSNNIQAAINNQSSGAGQQQTTTASNNAGRQAATKVNNGGGNNVTNIPAPQTGINYRVQIAAGHTPVNAGYFKATKGINDYVNVEDHDGWKKYTIGGYAQYKEARDQREFVRNTYGVNGPFVTAYNNGVRITVQEALMISNQRWVQ